MAPLRVTGCAMPNGKTSIGPDAWSLSGRLSCDDNRPANAGGVTSESTARPGTDTRTRPRPRTGHRSSDGKEWRAARPAHSRAGFPPHIAPALCPANPHRALRHSLSPAAPAGAAHSSPEQEPEAGYS